MMTKDEELMFGMSKEDIQEQYIESLTARLSGLEMVVASILMRQVRILVVCFQMSLIVVWLV